MCLQIYRKRDRRIVFANAVSLLFNAFSLSIHRCPYSVENKLFWWVLSLASVYFVWLMLITDAFSLRLLLQYSRNRHWITLTYN